MFMEKKVYLISKTEQARPAIDLATAFGLQLNLCLAAETLDRTKKGIPCLL